MKQRSKLDKPKTAALIVAWVSEGKSDREIVGLLGRRRVKATHQGITRFRARHASEIAAITTQAVAVIGEAAIVEKTERVRRLAGLVDGMQHIIDTRGLMADEPKWIGGAEGGREVTVERFDAALVREYRGALSDVSEELGQKPQRGQVSEVPPQWTQLNITIVNDNRQVKIKNDRRGRVIED